MRDDGQYSVDDRGDNLAGVSTFTTLLAKAAVLCRWRGLVVVVLCLGLVSCAEDGSVTWRQKTTIVVETPSGVKTGSSVVEVDWFAGYSGFTDNMKGAKGRLKGEAVMVDLGGGKYLFGLLKGDFGSVMGTSKRLAERKLSVKQAVAAVRERGKVTLPRDLFPMLVRFEDIDDPKSVKQVPPAGFGSYRIKEITFEVTDQPVTEGRLQKVLGWVVDLNGGYLSGKNVNDGSFYGLHGGDFRTGYPK